LTITIRQKLFFTLESVRGQQPWAILNQVYRPKGKLKMAENYELKPEVILSHHTKTKLKIIADKYYSLTKKKIVVTSGARTAKSQAHAMYGKLTGGDKLAIYKNQAAALQIKKIYDEAVESKKTKNETIFDIEKVIKEQIKKQVYISKHLKENAVDIRSRDMSTDENNKFKMAEKGFTTRVILETTPPHFHVQF